MLEHVLHIAADPARWHTTDEVSNLECSQRLVELAVPAKRNQNTPPKSRAYHRGVQEGCPRIAWQRVQTTGDRGPDCGREVGAQLMPLGQR